jgi:trigger factor
LALLEGCKHELEIFVTEEEVVSETERAIEELKKKVRLPGFRPGKAPASLIRSRFESDIRQDVLESLVPKSFRKKVEDEGLHVVGTPNISDVHFHKGEGLHYKAEFEVAPEFELKDVRELSAAYADPQVNDTDVDERIGQLREQKAEYVNIDPRPVENGDFAVVELESLSGVEGQPVRQDDVQLHVGSEDTMPAFTENLLGMQPEEEKEFDVTYPEDFGQERLAGKTVRFRMKLKGIRRKELPELNDEFAKDLGDFQNLEELRDAVRKTIFREREGAAVQKAKNELIDKLVNAHEFPVPEAFIERQIENQVEQYVRTLASQGIDPSKLKLDWDKVKESQRDKAIRDVKASLLLDKLAERESIYATQDEVDREVQLIAKREREPVAAVRMKLEKNGVLGRIASHIRTEKSLNHLFEQARKEAPAE